MLTPTLTTNEESSKSDVFNKSMTYEDAIIARTGRRVLDFHPERSLWRPVLKRSDDASNEEVAPTGVTVIKTQQLSHRNPWRYASDHRGRPPPDP
jgi:hypothetical protein